MIFKYQVRKYKGEAEKRQETSIRAFKTRMSILARLAMMRDAHLVNSRIAEIHFNRSYAPVFWIFWF